MVAFSCPARTKTLGHGTGVEEAKTYKKDNQLAGRVATQFSLKVPARGDLTHQKGKSEET